MGGRALWPGSRLAGILCSTGVVLILGCGGSAPMASRSLRAPSVLGTETTATGNETTPASNDSRIASAPARTRTKSKPAFSAPRILRDPIPYSAKRKREMVAYALRHYGLDTYRLIDPRVIVE